MSEDDALECKIKVRYRNHRGVVAVRTITPVRLRWGRTEYHPEPQWLLECYDHDRKAHRSYALADCDFTNSVTVPLVIDAKSLPWAQDLGKITVKYRGRVVSPREVEITYTTKESHEEPEQEAGGGSTKA